MNKIIRNESNLKNVDVISNKVRAIILDDELNTIIINYGDVFMLPGGKIDKNENNIEALIREIKEELGIDISNEIINPFIHYSNYIKDYPQRGGKAVDKLNSTKYYIVKTNKTFDLNKNSLTGKEKNDKFEILSINIKDILNYIQNYKSNNPRYIYFKNEILDIIEKYLKENEVKMDLEKLIETREKRETKMAVDVIKKDYYDLINRYKNSDKIIDMHTHTNYSDGELLPDELIKLAIEKNIGTLAITDHDTIEGIKKVDRSKEIIKKSGIKIIDGIELSAKATKGRIHILGYGIDLNNKELNNKMSELKDNSINSVLSLYEQLKKDYNIRFRYDDIKELVNANHNLGRPDLAKLLLKYGYVETIAEAFSKYLNNSYSKIRGINKGLKYDECIELITNSGGIPVLAHPKTLELDEKEFLLILKDMISRGLKGIEVYHSIHSKEEMEYYLNIANKYDLLISGGSDFHGRLVKPDIEIGTGKNNNLKIKKLSLLKKL